MASFLLGGTCSFDRASFTGEPAERQSSLGLYVAGHLAHQSEADPELWIALGQGHARDIALQGRVGQLQFQYWIHHAFRTGQRVQLRQRQHAQ